MTYSQRFSAAARGFGRVLAGRAHAASLIAACGVMATLAGCGGRTEIVEGPVYPAAVTQSATLNIQVVRSGTSISMTNTTARALGPCRVWVNRAYSYEIPGMKIGETLTLPLGDFQDQFGDAFRAGGFFANDLPDRIYQVQLEIDGQVLGLIYVSGNS